MGNSQIIAFIVVALIIVLYLYQNAPSEPPTIAPDVSSSTVSPDTDTDTSVIAEEPTSVTELTNVPATPPKVTKSSPSVPGPGVQEGAWLDMVENERLDLLGEGGIVVDSLGGKRYGNGWLGCQNACANNAGCGGWTMSPGGQCWLTQPGYDITHPGAGWKYQFKR